MFLHEVGHILGFRHEHAFLSLEERCLIGFNESSSGCLLLQDVVDKSSIMSYGYLHNFKENMGRAELSETDQLQAKKLYDKLHGAKNIEIILNPRDVVEVQLQDATWKTYVVERKSGSVPNCYWFISVASGNPHRFNIYEIIWRLK